MWERLSFGIYEQVGLSERVEEDRLRVFLRRLKILSPLRSLQQPSIEASDVDYIEAGCLAVALLKGAAAAGLDGSNQVASWQTIYVVPRLAAPTRRHYQGHLHSAPFFRDR